MRIREIYLHRVSDVTFLHYIISIMWRLRCLHQTSSLLVLAKVQIKGQKSKGQGNANAGDARNSEERGRCHRHHS